MNNDDKIKRNMARLCGEKIKNAKGYDRLLKLADYLEKLKPGNFNFSYFAIGTPSTKGCEKTRCGTVACAIGWCPAVFPKHWEWHLNPEDQRINDVGLKKYVSTSFDAAEQFFNLPPIWAMNLFSLGEVYHGVGTVSPRNVATAIREYVSQRDPRQGQ